MKLNVSKNINLNIINGDLVTYITVSRTKYIHESLENLPF